MVFYGRDDIIKEITKLLIKKETSRVCILGAGGMGKTSVALGVVEQLLIKGWFIPKGFTSEKSVKTHHPSRVPDFAHGVLVSFTYIGKDCSLAHLYYQFKYNIYLSFLVGDGCHDDVGACETSDASLLKPV